MEFVFHIQKILKLRLTPQFHSIFPQPPFREAFRQGSYSTDKGQRIKYLGVNYRTTRSG
jgi:hypothetical protein